MAKSPVAKKSAPKKPTAGSKKGVGGKKSVSAKKTAPPKKTVAAKKPASARKPGRRKDNPPPTWTPGQLTVQNGVVGLQTAEGFVSLQQVADAGQQLGLVFPLKPTGSGSAELVTTMDKLMEFMRTYANGSILGNVTCCKPK